MYKFVEFNAVKFLKSARNWDKEKRRLMDRLCEITEIKAMDNSPIRSGRLHDSVPEVVAERERIKEQINRINVYEEALWYAYEKLTDEEATVIHACFWEGGNIGKNVERLAEKYGIRVRGVYEIRRNAVDKIKKSIEEKYF